MALFFLKYDPQSETANVTLYEDLEARGAIKVLEGTYVFDAIDTSSAEIRDHYKAIVNNADSLIVIQPRTWAGYNLQASPNDVKKA